jgi:predicted neutral ceramidase superfamily lipid hydrolase
MAIIFRILLVIVGYILACVAASIVLTIGTLTPQWDDLSSLGLPSAILWSVVGVGAAFIAAIAALPALLVIALAEGFALRSGLVYAVLGAVLALSLSYGLDFAGYAGEAGGSLTREREVIAAAGIAGGFIYWLLAGRRAGSWK